MIKEIFAEEIVSPARRGWKLARFNRARLRFDTKTKRIVDLTKLNPSEWKRKPRAAKTYGVVIPGLVDSHTHLIFSGNRSTEWNRRLKGESYESIAKKGGGIKTSVRETRKASNKILFELGLKRLSKSLEFGVTTIEIKSGYGLDLETELRILQIATRLKKYSPLHIYLSFMGAHALPAEFKNTKSYAEYLEKNVLERASKWADFQDIFVERGYFGVAESISLLEAGKKFGLRPKVHAHEFGRTGGVDVACRVNALSADHLQYVNQADISKMKAAKVIPVVLPSTSLFLGGKKFADARRMIDGGLDLAIASDFNPGTNPSQNLPLAGSFAAIFESMSLDEVLTSQTRNAAWALGLKDRGILAPGFRADFVCLDASSFEEMYYYFGQSIVKGVYVGGKKAL